MRSEYKLKIADLYNILIGNVKKLVPKFFDKEKFSILSVFILFSDFLTFPCYKETDEVSKLQLTSVFFYLQPSLNTLFSKCVKLY